MQMFVRDVIKREKDNQVSLSAEYKDIWMKGGSPQVEMVIDLWNAEFERATEIMMETNASFNHRLLDIYNLAKQRANSVPEEADDIWNKALGELNDAKEKKRKDVDFGAVSNWSTLFMEAMKKMEKIIDEKRTKMTDITRSETSFRRAMMDDEKRLIQTLTSWMWKEKREIEEKQKKTTQCVANNMTSMRSNGGALYGRWDSSATSHKYVYHHMTNGTVAALQMKY